MSPPLTRLAAAALRAGRPLNPAPLLPECLFQHAGGVRLWGYERGGGSPAEAAAAGNLCPPLWQPGARGWHGTGGESGGNSRACCYTLSICPPSTPLSLALLFPALQGGQLVLSVRSSGSRAITHYSLNTPSLQARYCRPCMPAACKALCRCASSARLRPATHCGPSACHPIRVCVQRNGLEALLERNGAAEQLLDAQTGAPCCCCCPAAVPLAPCSAVPCLPAVQEWCSPGKLPNTTLREQPPC